MKASISKSALFITLLLISAFISNSCKNNIPDEVKVPDFATLSAQFNEPPAEYASGPLFVWNEKITKEEIDSFLVSFKNQGIMQPFIHPRPGLVTEYLSDEWFEYYRYTVEKGKELGMKIWIYDENSYPSGFAGGHVPDQMPESFNQGQGLVMTRVETLPDTAGKFFICLKEENGKYTDITASLSSEKENKGNYLLFSKTYYGKSDWFGGFSYVDLLVPGVTQKFIDVTMTGYEKNIGKEFGKTVPGTFTDEPEISSPGGIRWTPDLFDVFLKQWNYDLKTNLPSLYEETGDWKKVRHNYTQTLLQLFIDRWAKPWHRYCEEKGLIFTGHYWEHEWPNMHMGGDNMAMYPWHQMPAIDMLFNQFNDSSVRAQFGNVRSVKELASAANQAGRQRKMSETYGGSGWDLTFRDMKRNGDWEYALGVNFLNQHLTYFTMAGARKYDYPPAFDYHEPWWKDYWYINNHYARLSLALSSGLQVNDILVIEPTTTTWLYDSYVKQNPKCQEIGQEFQTFITRLEKEQVEYDLGSENIMKDIGSVSKGKLNVGKTSYSRVILPPGTENLDRSTFDLLKKFVLSGGKLIAFSEPSLINGSPSEELTAFFKDSTEKIISATVLNHEIISKLLANADLEFNVEEGGTLYHHRRMLTDGQLVFLVNSDLESYVNGSLTAEGTEAVEMNTLTGEIYGYQSEEENGRITLSYSLPPAGSLLLYIPDKGNRFVAPLKNVPETGVASPFPIIVSRDRENALMIDFCDIDLGNGPIKDLHTFNAADTVFKHFGFRNGNPWNTSVQFRTNIIDRDTFGINTGFLATYHFTIRDNFDLSGLKAVIERPGNWSVTVNGTDVNAETDSWWLDRSMKVFRIGNVIKQGENIITLKVSPMKVHAEVEPIYLVGDFSLIPDRKGWLIKKPTGVYTLDSWKDQEMPFYSWGVTYRRDYSIEKADGDWAVALNKWSGTVAEVYVNGIKADPIAFPPYTTDVTGLIRPGINKVEIKIIGSLRNLQGPHHSKPNPGFVTPWTWRNIGKYPPGKDYSFLDYGLFEEFVLLRSE
ncbi:MAG TPA: glycosyl hydrolase [Bacteroidales bacterium]|nr:glycosyl hydrolase [Bacteroidales bacterium]